MVPIDQMCQGVSAGQPRWAKVAITACPQTDRRRLHQLYEIRRQASLLVEEVCFARLFYGAYPE